MALVSAMCVQPHTWKHLNCGSRISQEGDSSLTRSLEGFLAMETHSHQTLVTSNQARVVEWE